MAVLTTTKVGPKFQVTIPRPVRETLGLKAGDLVQASVGPEGTVVLRKKLVVDYNPELEKELAEAEQAYRQGRFLGPFRSVAEVKQALKEYTKKKALEVKQVGAGKGRRASSFRHAAPSAVKPRAHARRRTH